MLEKLCSPALLYLAFSVTQIIIDIFKNLYNTAFVKFIIMSVFTLILQILCDRGLGIISWFIVFIPFITMTLITSIILFVFGLSPETGNIRYASGKNSNTHNTPHPNNTPHRNNNNNNKQQFKNNIQSIYK
jgi:hypothetical protein